MSKHTVGGSAAMLILVAAIMAPIHAQDQAGASETPRTEVAAPAEPAEVQPEAAPAPPSDVVPTPPVPTSQPARPAVATPAAAKPGVAKPAVAKPAMAKPATPKPATPKPAPTVSIQGKLELIAGQKQSVDAGEVADGLVYFLPKAGNPKPKPGYFTIRTHSKGFSPALVVVPAGSTIAFPNRDTVLHNVFSRTPGATFDLGNYGPGQSRQQIFSKPGLITVNCSVHYTMRATVVVMATPYYTRPDRNGRFELAGLPPGAGTLVYWHPRSAAATTQVSFADANAQGAIVKNQRLVATKPRSDHHAGAH